MSNRKIREQFKFFFDETEEGLVTVPEDKATIIKEVKVFTDGSYEAEYFAIITSTLKKEIDKDLIIPDKKDLVELPEDVMTHLPIIPDGVQEIELTEEMEQLLFGDEFEVGNEDD